ncbi:MAG: glycoside hydrolase family 88 protein [Bacteroidales bacterium]|nr:glycoside hydrolase family 88 protein [Bacteroidales bacterium]
MKKRLLVFMLLFGNMLYAETFFSGYLQKKDVETVCNAVAEWQITNHPKAKHHLLDWTNGALYRGVIEWGKTSGNQKCFDFLNEIGKKNNWNMLTRPYHADDICVGQTFIEMYIKTGNKKMLQPVMERAFYVASHPSKAPLLKTDRIGRDDRWSWCDALFMAPPVYAALYRITGEKIYLNYLDNEYKACYDSLYDKKEKLFYRDNTRIPLREKNGAKQFWGRGNGWVYAGLPLVIDNLPANCPSRAFYISLFTEMSEAVINSQCEGGEWRASLLDPDSFKMPENSCSAFMCYGIAWGIRKNYLPKKKFMPVLEKGWQSLVKAVHEDGMLGYIQPIGFAPEAAGYDATDVYGVGAFLLAGSEISKL